MTIFEAIINFNLEEVKRLIENKLATVDDLEPESFVSIDGKTIHRKKRKTVLELTQFLNRTEIVEYLKLTSGKL